MLSIPLLKRDLKSCYKVFFLILAILLMYTLVIIYMYNPKLSSMLNDYQKALPEMMSAVGMTGIASNLTEWIQIYLYGFIMLLFPLIFIIVLVNKLLMHDIDTGSFASLLSSPNQRGKILLTQIVAIFLWLTILMVSITGIAILFSESEFPNQLEIDTYVLLNACTLLLWFFLASIAIFVVCFASEAKYYYMFGAGIPILCFVIQMLANMGDKFEWLKYFSFYSFLPTSEIIHGKSILFSSGSLTILTLLLLVSGYQYFKRRDFFL